MNVVNGSTTASWNRLALLPKCRKIITSVTPARSAMSRVEAPLKPCWANASRAASRSNCRPRPRTLDTGWTVLTGSTLVDPRPSGPSNLRRRRLSELELRTPPQEPGVDGGAEREKDHRQPDPDDPVPRERPMLHVDHQYAAGPRHGIQQVEVGRPAGPERVVPLIHEPGQRLAQEQQFEGGNEPRPHHPPV